MASLVSHFFALLFFASLLRSALSEGHRKEATLFVFGDSLFDTGINQYINGSGLHPYNFYPYGMTFFHHATGRVSDGRVVPDFIAQYAQLPLLPPYLQPGKHDFTIGSNFASAGASVLHQDGGMGIDLHGQLGFFKDVTKSLKQKLGDAETKKLLMRAVYLFSMGGNDYFRFSRNHPNASESYQKLYTQMVIGNLTQVIREIYELGGRKIAFQNVGPLGCTPGNRPEDPNLGACQEFPLHMAQRHNRILHSVLTKLESELPGFKFSIFDYYNALKDKILNPSKYGFKVGNEACCGTGLFRSGGCGSEGYELCHDPFEYVWFDGAHTTEAANHQLAKLIWSGSPPVTGPLNVKQLFQL
ncbi:hypothetical protein NMG60_11004009 [Bertholletia excelsa]